MEENKKDLRMVFWVPYNISEIQKGIQAGHASQEYERLYNCPEMDDMLYKEFRDNYKTWMIYNGGTTNSKSNENGYIGTLNNIQIMLTRLNIPYSKFHEPDLNDALTAICCIIDYAKLDFETPIEDLPEDSLTKFIREQRFA